MALRMVAVLLSVVILLATMGVPASAQVTVNLQVVAEGLTAPLLLISPPDGTKRRFIIEQIGLIKILMPDGKMLDEPFLNLRQRIVRLLPDFDERGLLALAFHPDYKNNGKFYVAYSGYIPGESTLDKHLWYSHTNYVAEYRVSSNNPNRADPLSERILTRIDWPQFNHNGHWIGFGPDGYLYISTGDGGYANDWGIGHHVTKGNGQDLGSLNGKILRVDVNGAAPYAVPADNPFVGRTDARPEIWAYGFRNPWRCAFDTGGGKELFCADVGQNTYEEVDIVTKGGNYGWRVKEGKHCFDYANPNAHPATCNDAGMIDPILEYNNCNVHKDCKGISVTGGYVYRGSQTAWQGKYFFGDWSRTFAVRDGHLFVASKTGTGWTMEDVKVGNMPSFNSYVLAFGQDADGELYVMTQDTTGPVGGLARVYKIIPWGAKLREDMPRAPRGLGAHARRAKVAGPGRVPAESAMVGSVRVATIALLSVVLAGLLTAQIVRAQGVVFTKEYLEDARKIDLGRKVWVTRCQFCHGKSAYPGKAPKLDPSRYTPEFVFDRVTNGFQGMPAWKHEFGEEERRAVVAYILSKDFSN